MTFSNSNPKEQALLLKTVKVEREQTASLSVVLKNN